VRAGLIWYHLGFVSGFDFGKWYHFTLSAAAADAGFGIKKGLQAEACRGILVSKFIKDYLSS